MTKADVISSLLKRAQGRMDLAEENEAEMFMKQAMALTEAAQRLMKMERVKNGQWEDIRATGGASIDTFEIVESRKRAHCSECGEVSTWVSCGIVFQYCPNCGAKMDGGEMCEAD